MSAEHHSGVHRAMAVVSVELERQRLARIEARNAEHIAKGGSICQQIAWPLKTTCTQPAIGRYQSGWCCRHHTPAKLAGRPEPPRTGCSKPLVCYGECCRTKSAPAAVELRSDLEQRIDAWRVHARSEIMTLATLGYPFGPRELAALLPTRLAGDAARDWLTRLLNEGVNAGALVQIGKAEWRARRADEPVQHIETQVQPPIAPQLDSDLVERDNRYL